MKFIILASSLAAVAQAAIEANTGFGLLVLRSGTPVHLSSPTVDSNGKLVIGAGEDYFNGVFRANGTISTSTSNEWLSVGSDGSLEVSSSSDSTFEVASDYPYLEYDNSEAFTAVLEGDTYYLYAGNKQTNNTFYNIALSVIWSKNSTVTTSSNSTVSTPTPTPLPGNSTISANSTIVPPPFPTNATVVPPPFPPNATSFPTTVVPVPKPSSNSTSNTTTPGVPQNNGAVSLGYNAVFAAAIAGAAALLL